MSIAAQYTIRDSKRVPITIGYNGHSVIPRRYVQYKVVKIITIKIGRGKNATRYAMGESFGLQYGIIRHMGEQRIVTRKMQSNGNWSQWEIL